MEELVSIVIPTYKNRGRLRDSVLSALTQDYTPIEVIVVDDNNPDSDGREKTIAIMDEFAQDERVHYIKHPKNLNGAAARNNGIKAAKGNYIAFLDDDDCFLPSKIRKQLFFLKDNPSFDAVYCYAGRNNKRYGSTSFDGNATKQMLMLETCMYTPTLMFRRDALLTINGFDEAFQRHQDYDLMLRFFHAGFKIGCVHEILCDIGTNDGENALSGRKMEETKAYFFEKFQPYIDGIDTKERGFTNKVYAKHYAGVFLTHLKSHEFKMAWNVFGKYFFKSPRVFCGVVNSSLKQHLKGIV